MQSCKDKDLLSNMCTDRKNARCIDYEGQVADNSPLADSTCVNLHEVTEDLYGLLEDLERQLVPAGLTTNSCLEYPIDPTHADILTVLDTELCKIKANQTTDALEYSVSDLDMKCLTTQCGDQIVTVKELLQALIDKVCTCCNET